VVEGLGASVVVGVLFGQAQGLLAAGDRLLVLAQRHVGPGQAGEGREACGVVQISGRGLQGVRAVGQRLLRIVALKEIGEPGEGARPITSGERGEARLDLGDG
jgi:hypothetical protein